MDTLMEPLKNKPKCRVELHVHLDGAARHETLWEAMRQKGIKLPGNGSLEDFKNALKINEPKDLYHYLKGFLIYMDCLRGDLRLIERVAYEFVEDLARTSVAYCETRFSPHLLLPKDGEDLIVNMDGLNGKDGNDDENESSMTRESDMKSDDILDAVLRGLKNGEEDFGTKVNVILCCIRKISNWDWDILRLCEKYREQGVVGIDTAGDETDDGGESDMLDPISIAVFQAAKEKGIHRTVHAGEPGPAITVRWAIEKFGAERIGHGYRVLEDEAIYEMCRREDVHFEVCPHSSYLSGTMKMLNINPKRHPALRFAEDNVSFSINTDDPTLTFTNLSDEYRLLSNWGFTEAQIVRANFQAAQRSFLGPEEKKELIEQLKEAYGVLDYTLPVTSTSPRSASPPTKPEVKFGIWNERA